MNKKKEEAKAAENDDAEGDDVKIEGLGERSEEEEEESDDDTGWCICKMYLFASAPDCVESELITTA